ncbi:ATP-binding cassette domain-containing protein [Notoacmeibacter ruber]|uniref:ATP-binding cassette domain-containing protein n=1 Tax=Notoacmeibacter ruber TaxID=2670375 RepID=A0A3L7JFQ9_9HYPH|nr:ATP-binding cassette domain-containing protein [Notoacmeibacter ruber]RLQ89294.1 ATP-binding cassette domain-containing protein [Notoacmeibacter ruber]
MRSETSGKDADLVFRAVRIALAGKTLLNLDRSVPPGEILTVMGPSGTGKSSLLAYIGGFLDPAFDAEGEVWLGDRRLDTVPAAERRCGLLFQDALLFPHMNVGQNLAFALPNAIKGRQARRERVAEALAQIALPGLESRDPATLSGGQKARVALARTLLSQPEAMLLDEPFSSLDADLRAAMRELTFTAIRNAHIPAILVTHDLADAEAAGGPIVVIGETT